MRRYDYLPFGEEIPADGSARTTANGYQSGWDGFTLKFTGQLRDSETGLDFFNARYYSPAQGRFVSPDPENAGADLADPQSLNGYAYVSNSPLLFVDPLGLQQGVSFGSSEPADGSPFYVSWDWQNYGLGSPFYGPLAAPNPLLYHGTVTLPAGNPIAVGFWESMIPVWGSGKQAISDFEAGDWAWGTVNTGIAISDVVVLKSIATAVTKGAFKLTGSHSWSATRAWLRETGRVEYPGQHFHHWLLERNQGLGKYVPDAVKNQPYNLMGLPGTDFATSNEFHVWLHHEANPAQRLWYGTPAWAKAAAGSVSGRGANRTRSIDLRQVLTIYGR